MTKTSVLRSVTTLLTGTSVACLLGLSISSSQAIEVYKTIGDFGEVKYSQHAPKNAKKVEVIEFRSDGRQVNAGQMAGKTDPNQQQAPKTAEEQRVEQLEARLKQQEDQANAQRCQTLRNNMTNLNVGGRIYEMDANGNRKYLENREIELKRERLQQALTQYCSGQPT
ncbi:DUF4124 domain-containing protein [Psychrobacter arenosus]|uniref:DUF4124 domain-containing protein n=1 Tax=Psychrobacter arenosus TaxID=256326 RepID=UPI001919FA69|nr:DUF4124 domain-containing protein [Psychrobacter arenosus]